MSFNKWKKDIIFCSYWFNKFIKKSGVRSENLMYKTFRAYQLNYRVNFLFLFFESLEHIRPFIYFVPKRLGRYYYDIPIPVSGIKQYKLALKWLCWSIKKDTSNSLYQKILSEVFGIIFLKDSIAFNKKLNSINLALKNRTYTHYRW